MQKTKLRKRLQRGLALLAITSFVLMPVNLACAANNIIAGNSAVGDKTDISNGPGNVTDITSGFVHGGTGMNHFGNFDIGSGGTANLRGADRYINMVDKGININGILNSFNSVNLPANVMFISPEGMAVGAGGVLNVGGLQVITPATTDYSNLVGKLGAKDASLSEADHSTIVTAVNNQVAGGDANIYIGGAINSTGEVVLSAGDGIYFYNGGIIDTTGKLTAVMDGDKATGFKHETATGSQLASVSLFANTGNIIEYSESKLNGVSYKGQTLKDAAKTKVDLLDTTDSAKTNEIKIKSSKDITLSAVGGGIGGDISLPEDTNVVNSELAQSVSPINVSIKSSPTPAEDGKLNITVATTPALDTDGNEVPGLFKGYAAVANNTTNLNVGDVIGHNVKIQNKGFGTLATTEAIGTKDSNGKSNVGTLYLDAVALDVEHKITTNNIIRLNGASGIEADGNLEVLGDGYISVYSEKGAINMNDAKIKSGNINIKSNAANSSVTHGNLEITNRPSSIAGMLGLEDNSTLIQGVKSTEKSFRSDGIHVTSKNDITQKTGTAISSAGIVELNAGGNVTSTIKGYVDGQTAKDIVIVTAKDADLTTKDVVRLGAIEVDNLTVNAGTKDSNNAITNLGSIVVDDAVKAKGNITINATDKVTVRPHVKLEDGTNTDGTKWEHYSYGKIESDGIAGADGTAGKVTINANNGIFAVNPLLNNDNSSVNASLPVIINKAGDVKLTTISTNGHIKVIPNTDDVTSTNERLTIAAVGKVDAEGQDVYINLVNGATNANGLPSVATSGTVGTINARHNAKIGSVGKVLITDQINATNDVIVSAADKIIQNTTKSAAIVSGNDMNLTSTGSDIGQTTNYLTVDVNGDGVLTATASKGNIYIRGLDDLSVAGASAGKDLAITTPNGNLTISTATAGKDMILSGGKNINATTLISTNDMTITANGEASDIVLGSASAGKAGTTNGSMAVTATKDVKINAATANKDMSITSTDGTINVTELIKTNTGDMTLTAESGNVVVQAPSGSSVVAEAISGNDMTIQGVDVYLTKATAGNDLTVTASGMADLGTVTATKGNMTVTANKDVGITTATAGNNMTITSTEGNVNVTDSIEATNGNMTVTATAGSATINKATAGKDMTVKAKKDAKITTAIAGNNMTITSDDENIELGSATTTSGDITAKAKKEVNIKSSNSGKDLTVEGETAKIAKSKAKNNATVTAQTIKSGATDTTTDLVAGKDITLTATAGDIGEASKHFSVASTAGQVKAEAKTTGANIYLGIGADSTTHVSVIEAANDVSIQQTGDIIIDEVVKAGNDVKFAGNGAILQNEALNTASIVAGNDMSLTSNNKNVGDPNKYLKISLNGDLDAAAPNGGVYIEGADDALNVTSATAGKDIAIKVPNGALTVAYADAGNDLTLTSKTDIGATIVSAGNNMNIDAGGKATVLSATTTKNTGTMTIKAGKDVEVTTANAAGNVKIDAGQNAKLTKVTAGKNADVTAKGNIDVTNILEAGENLTATADGHIHQATAGKVSYKSGKDMSLTSKTDNVGDPNKYLQVSVGGKLDASAEKGGVYIGTPDNLTIGKVVAGNDAVIIGDGYIHQTERAAKDKPAITTGKNLTLKSNDSDVGDPNNYLSVKVGEALNATAPNGGVYIEGIGNLNIDLVEAKTNVGLEADGYIHQIAPEDPANPRVISGGNMHFKSANDNVGDPDNYLQVSVGGVLDASAPKGGVYIGSRGNLLIDEINAGKDVGIETGGWIHETGNKKPAITSGEDMHLISFDDNVGDPDHYLTVSVGGELDAAAPTEGKGVYIYGYGDLTVDRVVAGEDVGIGGNKDIILPSDRDEGNIIAGRDVIIKAGDNVLNGGGEKLAIDAGRDIDVTANINENNPAGSIGKLPYGDLQYSINVTLDGEVRADEIGVPVADKILNIHIMGQDNGDDLGFDMDDRDQRNMKYLTEDDDSASVRNHRDHLRYNVATSEYVLIDSNSDSGSKVQDVLNISKQGMLVQTDETPNLGDNIQITLEYKGLPFTVEGTVVRADAAKGIAGVKFNSIDQFTSSMILYLGMLNGR